MNKEAFLGLVRHALTFGGGYMVAGGVVPSENMPELIAAVMTLIGGIWSIMQKKEAAQKETAVGVEKETTNE